MVAIASKYRKEIFNQLINIFWTLICFAPVARFWIQEGVSRYFYLIVGFSLVMGLLPEKILNRFMISSGRRVYEKLGVRLFRKFVQYGDVAKALSGGQEKSVIRNVSTARKYMKTIAMYERFHWACLIFFLSTAFFSFLKNEVMMGVIITIANALYNLPPIFLQQYNKIRIRKMIG